MNSKLLASKRHFGESEVAKERLRILEFYTEFGEHATKKAFGIDRKTLWVWKNKLKHNKQHLEALVPASTRPHHFRSMHSNPLIISFMRDLRMKHPKLGKEKIKPLLDQFCLQHGLPPLSVSTIGKVIKRNKLFFQKQGKLYHNPQSGFAHQKRTKRIRVKRMPKNVSTGYIQMDTVVRFVDGITVYLYSAIDCHSKFAFSVHYKTLNSQNTVDFFKKLEIVCPFPITVIQTDNGLEFLGDFDDYLLTRQLPHVFIYPRCCKVNGVVERYQRSLQEEFLDNHLEFVYDPTELNDKLIDYLLFYNTQRVHKSLGLKTPVDYLISKGEMSKMYTTRTGY